MNKKIMNACFVMAQIPNGEFAATSRLDKNKFGLPGGKQDPGETLYQTALRESSEEGWKIDIEKKWFFRKEIEGFNCYWFIGNNPKKLEKYKESGRIEPLAMNINQIISSAPELGNKEAYQQYKVEKLEKLKQEALSLADDLSEGHYNMGDAIQMIRKLASELIGNKE